MARIRSAVQRKAEEERAAELSGQDGDASTAPSSSSSSNSNSNSNSSDEEEDFLLRRFFTKSTPIHCTRFLHTNLLLAAGCYSPTPPPASSAHLHVSAVDPPFRSTPADPHRRTLDPTTVRF